MALTQRQVEDVCLIHKGYVSCRYLSYDPPTNAFVCVKLSPRLKGIKDDAVKFNEREARRINVPVIDYFDLLGVGHEDNCGGYLCLKHAPQGYNVPKSP